MNVSTFTKNIVIAATFVFSASVFASTSEAAASTNNVMAAHADVEIINQTQLAMFDQLGESLDATVATETQKIIQSYEHKVMLMLNMKGQGVNDLLIASF